MAADNRGRLKEQKHSTDYILSQKLYFGKLREAHGNDRSANDDDASFACAGDGHLSRRRHTLRRSRHGRIKHQNHHRNCSSCSGSSVSSGGSTSNENANRAGDIRLQQQLQGRRRTSAHNQIQSLRRHRDGKIDTAATQYVSGARREKLVKFLDSSNMSDCRSSPQTPSHAIDAKHKSGAKFRGLLPDAPLQAQQLPQWTTPNSNAVNRNCNSNNPAYSDLPSFAAGPPKTAHSPPHESLAASQKFRHTFVSRLWAKVRKPIPPEAPAATTDKSMTTNRNVVPGSSTDAISTAASTPANTSPDSTRTNSTPPSSGASRSRNRTRMVSNSPPDEMRPSDLSQTAYLRKLRTRDCSNPKQRSERGHSTEPQRSSTPTRTSASVRSSSASPTTTLNSPRYPRAGGTPTLSSSGRSQRSGSGGMLSTAYSSTVKSAPIPSAVQQTSPAGVTPPRARVGRSTSRNGRSNTPTQTSRGSKLRSSSRPPSEICRPPRASSRGAENSFRRVQEEDKSYSCKSSTVAAVESSKPTFVHRLSEKFSKATGASRTRSQSSKSNRTASRGPDPPLKPSSTIDQTRQHEFGDDDCAATDQQHLYYQMGPPSTSAVADTGGLVGCVGTVAKSQPHQHNYNRNFNTIPGGVSSPSTYDTSAAGRELRPWEWDWSTGAILKVWVHHHRGLPLGKRSTELKFNFRLGHREGQPDSMGVSWDQAVEVMYHGEDSLIIITTVNTADAGTRVFEATVPVRILLEEYEGYWNGTADVDDCDGAQLYITLSVPIPRCKHCVNCDSADHLISRLKRNLESTKGGVDRRLKPSLVGW